MPRQQWETVIDELSVAVFLSLQIMVYSGLNAFSDDKS